MALDSSKEGEILKLLTEMNIKMDKLLSLEERMKSAEDEIIKLKLWESNLDGRILVTIRMALILWGLLIILISFLLNKFL